MVGNSCGLSVSAKLLFLQIYFRRSLLTVFAWACSKHGGLKPSTMSEVQMRGLWH